MGCELHQLSETEIPSKPRKLGADYLSETVPPDVVTTQEPCSATDERCGHEGQKSDGFTWDNAKCDSRHKVARCTCSAATTMVTQPVLTRNDQCDFLMRITRAGGKQVPLTFGIVGGNVESVLHQKIGDKELPTSFGMACIRKSGKVVQSGNSCGPAPGLCDGDVVRLQVRSGKVTFFKGNMQIGNCTVGGKGEFRIAVTFQEEGQQVEILEPVQADGPLGQVQQTWSRRVRSFTRASATASTSERIALYPL
eukprot:s1473_g20.t1